MDDALKEIYEEYFKFLEEDFGFEVVESSYDEEVFGNFNIRFEKGESKINIISDRDQVFVEVEGPDAYWKNYGEENKEGFKIENVSKELSGYLKDKF